MLWTISSKKKPSATKEDKIKNLLQPPKKEKNHLKPQKRRKRKKPLPAGHIRIDSSIVAEDRHLNCVVFARERRNLHHFTKKVFLNRSEHLGIEMLLAVVVQRKQVVFFGHVAPAPWQGG